MKKLLLLLFITHISAQFVAAQTTALEKQTDLVARQLKTFYNAKRADSIYGRFNAAFKSAVKQTAFENSLSQQLFPYGVINSFVFERSKNGANIYKAGLATGLDLNMVVVLDSAGLVSGFQIVPYKATVTAADKRTKYYYDNPLKTATDSLVHAEASGFMENTKSPGLAIGLLLNGQQYLYNYGDAKKDSIPVTSNTGFEIGSITKTFTAFLLANAVVQKKIKLTDAITKYLPDSVAANKDLQVISIQQLSNHSSGLPRLPLNLYAGVTSATDPYAAYDDKKLFTFLKYFKAQRKPGEKYEYSNLAVGLLGVILEKVNGMPLEKQYEQQIFIPFNMKNSYAGPVKTNLLTALGYTDKGEPTSYWNFKAMAAAGGIKSTTTDLLLYAKPFVNMTTVADGRYKKQLDLLRKITFSEDPAFIGLGWFIEQPDSANFVLQHSGGTGGFRTHIRMMPAKKMAVVVFNNSAEEPGSPLLATRIMEALLMRTGNEK